MSTKEMLTKTEIPIITATIEKVTKSFPKRLHRLSNREDLTMLKKNKEKQERKAKRKPVLRPCRFTKKTTYTRKKGRNRDE